MKTEIPKLPPVERRFTQGVVEIRVGKAEGEEKRVRGYAAMFGKRSQNLGFGSFEFYEIIERGAFEDALKDDVRALFNHDPNLILARSKNGEGTLTLGTDDVGLWYEFTPPDTTTGRDLKTSIARGDIDQSSFAFTMGKEGQKWEETRDGEKTIVVRTISKIQRLYDVSPVTYPAYLDATVGMRALEQFREINPQPPTPEPEVTFPTRSQWAARLGIR